MEPLGPGDPRTAGPYRLIRRLGSGGMGRVFLGESPAGRRVAVKVVRDDVASSPGFRDRFRREAKLAMRAGGFWAAQVVDADPDAETPWIASQYVDGPSLAERVRLQGPLDENAVRRLALGLAEALAAFHKGGLVHRDLKPSNVLLVDDGPRVIDFGISKAVETMDTSVAADLTRTGTILGTPGFMSPELALGRSAGPPSDVFSLGSLLVYAATGAGAFGDGPSHALLFRVVYEAPELDRVPPGLREPVSECLRKEPEERPSADELVSRFTGPQPAAPDPRVAAGAMAAFSRPAGNENGAGDDVPGGTGDGVRGDESTGAMPGGGRADGLATTGPQPAFRAGQAGAAAVTGSPGTAPAGPAAAAHSATTAPAGPAAPTRPAGSASTAGPAGSAGPAAERPDEPAEAPSFVLEEAGGAKAVWRRMKRPLRIAAAPGIVFSMVLSAHGAGASFASFGLLCTLGYLVHHLRFSVPLLWAKTLRVEADGLHVRQGGDVLTVPWGDVATVAVSRKNRRELALAAVLEKGTGVRLPGRLASGDGVLKHTVVSSAERETLTRAAGLEAALRECAGDRYRQSLPAAR